MGILPLNGNLPIEANGIPIIGWSNSQYRLQDSPVVGIATVFTLASIVCTYNHITVWADDSMNNVLSHCGLVEVRMSASGKKLPVL